MGRRPPKKQTSGRRTVVSASDFKARCLRILDDVANGQEVVVTKHGSEIAQVTPIRKTLRSSRGSWKRLVQVTGDIVHSDWSEDFDATR